MKGLIKKMVFAAVCCMGFLALSSAFSFCAFADSEVVEHEWTAEDWLPKRATPTYSENNYPDNSIFQDEASEDEINNDGNVNVCTSFSKCEGNEKTGTYWVNGVYEFSAGQNTVGNMSYIPKGYTLKIWNSDTESWNDEINPITGNNLFEGQIFTYTNCNARSRVQLTWEWKTKGKKIPANPTAKDYIQENLMYHFDAIENAGYGVPRNTQATVWKNCILGESHMTISNLVSEADAVNCWTNNRSCYLNGTTYTQLDGPITRPSVDDPSNNGAEWTFQAACQVTNKSNKVLFSINSYRGAWGSENGRYQSGDTVYGDNRKDANLYYAGESYGLLQATITMNDWDRQYFTIMRVIDNVTKTNKVYFFAGTTRKNAGTRNVKTASLYNKSSFGLGGNIKTCKDQQAGLYQFLRVYNRPLRDEELEWNRKIDEMRFNDIVVTNVIVETSQKDIECAEARPYYIEGEWTFNPPEAIINGKVKYPKSCSVYEYDNGTWRAIESDNTQVGYTYNADLMENRLVRIKWSYAQTGLVVIVK